MVSGDKKEIMKRILKYLDGDSLTTKPGGKKRKKKKKGK